MNSVETRLKKIISAWFIKEPLLFSVEQTHQLIPNQNITIPFRCGKKRIEYNNNLLESVSDELLEFYLKTEIFRILLGHPYTRLPYDARYGVLAIASDVTVYQTCYCHRTPTGFMAQGEFEQTLPGIVYLKNQAVRFGALTHPLGIKWYGSEEEKFFKRNLLIDHKTGALTITDNLTFEQWYRKILFLIKETSIAGENAGTQDNSQSLLDDVQVQSELWEENEEAMQEVRDQIKKAENEQGWGGIGGNNQRVIKEGADFSFDYRRALTHFRQSIVSANRTLTRMKPNRRYGLKAMGSRYERKANILIAVDVSGSITDESFEHFTKAVKNFFYLKIIENIDLIFFDVNLKNTTPYHINKKIQLSQIKGRGGTNFQPAIDFYREHKDLYSGMIIFTDGEGDVPEVGLCKNILWILESRISFEKSKGWITALPGCKATYLPF